MKTFHSILLAVVLIFSLSVHGSTLVRQNLSDSATGLEATYQAASYTTSDTVTNTDGKTLIHVKNPGASSATVTVAPVNATVIKAGYGTLTRASIVAALAAGEAAFLGPFPIEAFNSGSGNVTVTYGGAGSVDITIGALKLP